MILKFLGHPPKDITTWIRTHNESPTPPVRNEFWVPARYTQEWVFSDAQNHSITYEKKTPEQYQQWFDEGMPELTATIVVDNGGSLSFDYSNNRITLDRQYESWPLSSPKEDTEKGLTLYTKSPYIGDTFILDAVIGVQVKLADSDDLLVAYRKYIPGHWEDSDGNWLYGSWSEWSNHNFYWKDDHYEWAMANMNYYLDSDKEVIYPNTGKDNACLLAHYTEPYEVATRTWTNTKDATAT